jgi:hypothetical protein
MATRIWFFGTVCFMVLVSMRVSAEEGKGKDIDQKAPVIAQYLFDRKVTNWVEGTITSIGDKQFAMNKTQSFFAAKYAKMLNDINEKTTNFAPAEAARKAAEIRARWRTDIAAMDDPISEKEMAFLLPQQSGGLHVIDESGLYTREAVSTSGDSRQTSTDAYGKVSKWEDVKVGDRIVVGYQESTENRNALVVIRVTSVAMNMDAVHVDDRLAEVIDLKD